MVNRRRLPRIRAAFVERSHLIKTHEKIARLVRLACLAVTLSCSSSTEPGPPAVTLSPSLSTISAETASIVADGTTQTAINVTLKDANGAAYGKSGGAVTLSTTSGTLGVVADLNNGSYAATLTSSRTASNAVVTGSVAGSAIGSIASVSFVAGPVAVIGIANAASNGQTAIVGATVPNPPSVKVADANGNGIAGQSVTFSVTSGGGSVTGLVQTTNTAGVATAGSWTLGAVAGANTVVASVSTAAAQAVGSSSAVDRTVTFTATGIAGTPGSISLNGGDGQTAVVGSIVSTAPSVKVVDGNNNPVIGATVGFVLGPAGGTVIGGNAVTNSSGIAKVDSWRLGPIAGPHTLIASTVGVSGLVTFTATAIAAPAAKIANANVASNGQSAPAGNAVAIPPSVKVTDANGNAVAGVSVTFAVASGSGSVTGASQTTNSSGLATVGSWTLGTVAGANTMTATSGSLEGSPVTFTATGTSGAAGGLVLVAGDGQLAIAGTSVATAPSVKVVDLNGNAVAGAAVTFTVLSGGGSVTGANAVANALGVATVGSWKLGNVAGPNTLSAFSGSITPVTFIATGTAGAATTLAINAGNNQSATFSAAVAILPSVKVTDANGNAVAGTSVTFAVASGGGAITGGSATTDASGIATVGSWTLGSTSGANALTATSSGLAGSPATFTATALSGPPANIVKVDGDGQTTNAGTNVAVAPSVKVTASNGEALPGVTVTFAVASGGGSITGQSATTNATGVATLGSWKLGRVAGSNTLTATAASLAPVTFSATGSVGAATLITINAGNNQTATIGTAVAIAPSVKITDAVGNAINGASVTFALASGGGSMTGAAASTNASGIAALGSWTLGGTAGANTLTASLSGVAGATVTFTATGQAAPALVIDVAGTLERGEKITVTVTQNGSPLAVGSYTLTVVPSDAATIDGDGTLSLTKAGAVTLNASASGGASGTKNISVVTPPSVVFDLLNNGNRDIWRVALDGQELQQLTTDPADDQHPSAAAGKLMFASAREGNLHVYVVTLSGGTPVKITPNSSADTEPRISRNGQRFAYINNESGLGRATYANIDGSNPLPVANNGGNSGAIEFSPDWSPASDRIVFGSTAAGAADIYFANTLGSTASYFAGNSSSKADLQPVYSPDGQKIAFISNRAGSSTDLYVANVDGSNLQKVVSNASGPAWARSDRLVYETVVFVPGQPLRGTLHWIDPANPGVVHDIDVGAGDARNASPIFQ